jgi:hypothetical protein
LCLRLQVLLAALPLQLRMALEAVLGHSHTAWITSTATWSPCLNSLLASPAAAAAAVCLAPQLRKSLEALLGQPGAVAPQRARFFRGQMQTIISKALNDVGIKPLPSRRCFSIMSEWSRMGQQAAQGGRCRKAGGQQVQGGSRCRRAGWQVCSAD